jgi:ABC-type antimicrobial peptide transport system permease subunit
LLLAAIGVYGVVAFGVAQRRHEIGIRTALGAGRPAIMRMVLRQGLAHAGVGFAIGLPAALTLTRTMRGVVYDLNTVDPPTYAAVVLVLLLTAALASWIPARRAATLDPVRVVKGE